MNAIPTEHRGVTMRSRLEARTAEALDRLKVRWVYEAEGYDLDGIRYLPDFYLPDFDWFCEVKGQMDLKSVEKMFALAQQTEKPVLVVEPFSVLDEWFACSSSPLTMLIPLTDGALGVSEETFCWCAACCAHLPLSWPVEQMQKIWGKADEKPACRRRCKHPRCARLRAKERPCSLRSCAHPECPELRRAKEEERQRAEAVFRALLGRSSGPVETRPEPAEQHMDDPIAKAIKAWILSKAVGERPAVVSAHEIMIEVLKGPEKGLEMRIAHALRRLGFDGARRKGYRVPEELLRAAPVAGRAC